MYSFLNMQLKSKLLKAWKLIIMNVPFLVHQTYSPNLEFRGGLIKMGCPSGLKLPSLAFLVAILKVSSSLLLLLNLLFVTCVFLCYIFVFLPWGFTL
jgi:hypothetical protein